jgi:hypothetical protein
MSIRLWVRTRYYEAVETWRKLTLDRVRIRRCAAAIALALNLAGTVLVAWSFQATSSTFRLITAPGLNVAGGQNPNGKAYAICTDQLQLAAIDTSHNTFVGSGGCALWDHGSPAAIVTADDPNRLWFGFGLLILGFFVQLALAIIRAH